MKKRIIIILLIVLAIIYLFSRSLLRQKSNTEEIEELTGKIVLYFQSEDGYTLTQEFRNVSMKEIKENVAKTIIEELLKGPTQGNLKSTIPSRTKLLDVSLEGNIAKVNLSKEFIENQNGNVTECLHAVYSIVNSLTELSEINEVKFYIENIEVDSYKGYFDMSKPFVRST